MEILLKDPVAALVVRILMCQSVVALVLLIACCVKYLKN